MAARYWVPGGTGATGSTTNWSTTSGGSSGASVPGASDDAIFDANSGSGTVTFSSATWLSANFTGFTGTFAGTGTLTIAGGGFTLGSGMTITWTGALQFNVAGSTITANGKSITGNIIIASGFAPGGAITLSGNFQCGGFQHTVIAGTVNINGDNLILAQTSGTIMSTSSGRLLAGTSKIILAGTGNFNTSGISNNVDVNTSGTITLNAASTINGGTWKYYSGTWNNNGIAIQINGNCTLDLDGMTLAQLSLLTAVKVTLNSFLTITSNILHSTTAFEFDGAYGFSVPLIRTSQNTSGRTIRLAAGVEYFVTSEIRMDSGAPSTKNSFVSLTAGVKALLTFSGSILYLAQCNFTDIDASNGKTIWTYDGTVSNCDNIFDLPHSPKTIGTVN
ncbi:MAG: hypothetical protein L6Q66_08380 [Bacteroidia bacterium]|nr:hypothetical protein [Bacteroidia bacterium]